MARYTRSEFLRLSGASVAAGVFGASTRARAQSGGTVDASHPDLVLVNGRVSTMDDSLARAEAFAVKNGRFVAVGASDDIRNLMRSDTEVIDAEGQTVTPGFIDAHSHPASGGVRELVSVNLDLRSIDAIKDALRARATKTPPGEWVLGFKYDDTKVREDRQITRRDLDEAAPNHPVFVSHRGGHVYWYNTKAFEKAGVDAQTPDPPGGHIYKENGELTGKVAERANDLFSDVVPSGSTREQRRAGVKLISELMTSSGLTSVHDASCGSDSATAYQDAYHAGELRMRVYLMVRGAMFEGLKTAGVYTGLGNEWLKVGGVKFGADGSASGRTMAMSTPYEGRPDDFGILTMTQEEIHEAVEDAHRHDFQIGIHANGDLAIDMVLNAYERVLEKWPRPDARHRLEHCTLVNPDLLQRIKATGSIPTPFYTYVHYHGRKWEEYGPEKMKWMFAHRSFLDHGIPVAPASDYVPGPYEPMMAIQSMVTRRDVEGRVWGANQAVSVEEALRICTVNGAYASFEEDVKGSITAGKYADFVILGRDPGEVAPDAIKEIPIVRTVVGGITMHRQG
ncbi:MAG TPA: amidohydrolase family protein [Vicinamibacteria bacterium]|nr:amidohydrolase family protein [Vicinamibacteria bacterium]